MKKYLFLATLLCAVFFIACQSTPAAPEPEPQAAEKSSSRLRAEELVTGRSPTTAAASATTAATAETRSQDSDMVTTTTVIEQAADEITREERSYFESFLKRMKYLVVFKEGSTVPEDQVTAVLARANQLLLSKGYDVVHYEQLKKNMEDQRSAYLAEVGASMSIIQYLAQKLGADIYVEIDATPESWTEGGRHYGEARYAVNMFDPSTAELLGSVTYRSDRSVSTTSKADAQQNALVFSMGPIMTRVMSESDALMRNRYSNGIRFQVSIQRTPDSRAISTLRRNLRTRFREVRIGDSAADQTNFEVYYFGDLFDVQDHLELIFERTPGFESTYWVYNRGKTIVFNTGL